MRPIIAVYAQGGMGSAVGGCLVEHGADVVTALEGRSAASARRAAANGMRAVPLADFAKAEMILSIVPPGLARDFAQSLLPILTAAPNKPLFADCNALSPSSVRDIAAIIAPTGAPFVDASILGSPPGKGKAGPIFYACGAAAPRLAALNAHGLDIRVLDGPIGAASALKMCYGGLQKGSTGLAAAIILAADRSGSARALRDQIAETRPDHLAQLENGIRTSLPKAYRFVAEMEEIAEFIAEDPAASMIFRGMAQLYARLAADLAGGQEEAKALGAFFEERAKEPAE